MKQFEWKETEEKDKGKEKSEKVTVIKLADDKIEKTAERKHEINKEKEWLKRERRLRNREKVNFDR